MTDHFLEVDRNYAFVEELLGSTNSLGDGYVLIKNRELIGEFRTRMAAFEEGIRVYNDRLFSVQSLKNMKSSG